MSGDMIGKDVILKTFQESEHARGRVIAYTAYPTVVIETESGEHISWRADLTEVATSAVELPTEPTLGWLNGNPHLLAIWQDCSDTAARPPAIRPVNVPTPFDGDHIKSFTPATAVPTETLAEIKSAYSLWFTDDMRDDTFVTHWRSFLAAVDSANGDAS